VRFDDRLMTVLNQPGDDARDLAVRWRQLVDLVARAGGQAGTPAVGEALETIRADAPRVDEPLRAAAARAVAALPLPLGLLEVFASDRLSVSAPVLAAATLDAEQWSALLEVADEETRQFILALHPEVRPHAAPAEEPSTSPAEEPESLAPSLHDVVERIERRRRTRAAMRAAAAPAGDAEPGLFRWECGPTGEIAWVEGAPRGALVGRSIAKAQTGAGDRIDADVVRAFALRAPFRDAALTFSGEGALAGEWKISGVPAFEPSDGRFAGYRGIALRDQEPDVGGGADPKSDADSVRELVHEIKTPLNAIMGFAEIIEGQYLGPAEQAYRERAQEIVRQARLLLMAIDDLDFAARVQSAAAGTQSRTELGELLERLTPALRETASEQGVEIDASPPTREALAAAEPELADRLIFRLCSAVLEQASAGERLRLAVEQAGDRWRVSIGRPRRLAGTSQEQLFGPAEPFGFAFPLRLVRGLARSVGADVIAAPAALAVSFPRA
jgi:hypothetical protein